MANRDSSIFGVKYLPAVAVEHLNGHNRAPRCYQLAKDIYAVTKDRFRGRAVVNALKDVLAPHGLQLQ
jgi:hypothetical protein